MKKISFKGGIHPKDFKEMTCYEKIKTIKPTAIMVYPIQQHIGAPCKPIVKKGDCILLGQKIAEATAFVSVPIHSTVSGRVKGIEERMTLMGQRGQAIVIENDFLDEPHVMMPAYGEDYKNQSKELLLSQIKEAGLVGMGGATFPTHVKLTVPEGKQVHHILINAAECEPYLTSDYRVMLEESERIVEGIKILLHMFKEADVTIGIEDNKRNAVQLLKEKIGTSTKVQVVMLQTKYPQGSEKQLIDAVVHKEISRGGLPIDIGCVVVNIETVIGIWRAVVKGRPSMRRIVTVSGKGVLKPGNYKVRLGMSVRELLESAQWKEEVTVKIIAGGPMMGMAISDVDVPIMKGTSAILCFTAEEARVPKVSNCIRCGKCIAVCPMHLMPMALEQAALNQNDETFERHFGRKCIECGSCAYICPVKRQLVQSIRTQKYRIKQNNTRTEGS